MLLADALIAAGVTEPDAVTAELISVGVDPDRTQFHHVELFMRDLRARGWVSDPETYLQGHRPDRAGHRKVLTMIEVLRSGADLPPVLVVRPDYNRDALYVADGLHRLAAAGAAGRASVPALIADTSG